MSLRAYLASALRRAANRLERWPRKTPNLQHTPDLFASIPRAVPAAPGALNFSVELRAALSQALKTTPHTRYQVAAQMGDLLGLEVTKYQLDSWTAESRDAWRFPFEYAAAFEVACETACLQELLARTRGYRLLEGEDSLLVDLGRIEQMEGELKRQKQEIKQYLGRKK